MTLKINGNDYSNRIIAGSYSVNKEDEYKAWTDADGTAHRQIIRTKIKGSFDMFFRSQTEYTSFVSHIRSSKRNDLSIKIKLDVNNTNENVESYFFLEFAPTRNIDGKWTDYMERYTVKIEEK